MVAASLLSSIAWTCKDELLSLPLGLPRILGGRGWFKHTHRLPLSLHCDLGI